MRARIATLPVQGLLDAREQSDAKRSKVVLDRRLSGAARATPSPQSVCNRYDLLSLGLSYSVPLQNRFFIVKC